MVALCLLALACVVIPASGVVIDLTNDNFDQVRKFGDEMNVFCVT